MVPPVPRTVVVIPTYNERETIRQLMPQVLAATDCQVIVVDDDSPDGTAAVVAEMAAADPRVHLVNHRPKMGIGPAYKEGFRAALALEPDLVIQMDADGSHPPAMLPEFVKLAADNDLVLGSRYLHGITVVNWPIERILISYFGNAYVRRVAGLRITDTTGGFRCMRRELLERLGIEHVRANGYGFQIELNYRLARAGANVMEIPFFFSDRRRGTSKLSWRIGFEAIWIALRLRVADALGLL